MRKPFFSIVIPTYNRASDVAFALQCILRQTFTNYEVVICDNASTDTTKRVVTSFTDRRIRYVQNKHNIGLSGNQKRAITYARGVYVFLHGDDDFLLYVDSLEKIYNEIHKKKPGYVRLNYASLALDNRHIFTYKVNKAFKKDSWLRPDASNTAVLSFVTESDHYFFSGILFRNNFPKHIHMVDADPSPWIAIVLYAAKTYGACFIDERHIIARWSRRTKRSEDHGFYAMVNGKLKAENYFAEVKKFVNIQTYTAFLHRELITIYVNLFPAVKVSGGDKPLRQVAARVRVLDPSMGSSFLYWKNYLLSRILPHRLLIMLRGIFLFFYVRYSKVDDEHRIHDALRQLPLFADGNNTRGQRYTMSKSLIDAA